MNYTVHMETLATIQALIFGSSNPELVGDAFALVSFSPRAWHGLGV